MRYLALRFGQQLNGQVYTRIPIKLTQQDIASLCNMSRETTNIEVAKLKHHNTLIEKNKQYSVHMGLLNKLIGDDLPTDLQL